MALRRTTDLRGRPAHVAETVADMRALGHTPKRVSVHGKGMQQCSLCGARLGSYASGRRCSAARGASRARGSIAQRWAEVHAAQDAGHPIRHPRAYVFGAAPGSSRRRR